MLVIRSIMVPRPKSAAVAAPKQVRSQFILKLLVFFCSAASY